MRTRLVRLFLMSIDTSYKLDFFQADDGKSSLRDLLGTEEEMSPGPPEEREVLRMDLADTEVEFPGAPHRWICDGTLLRLEEPGNSHNLGLFKVCVNCRGQSGHTS